MQRHTSTGRIAGDPDPTASAAEARPDFEQAAAAVAALISGRHGVAITTGDVGEQFKGDLDGAEIVIAPGCDAETTLFLLAHLFGHTVQWNTSETSRRIGLVTTPAVSAAWLAELAAYELEACRYGQTLLHDAGVRGLDEGLADYAACDAAYLRHFYATGARGEFLSFWRPGQPLLEPLAIPAFTPRRWRRRSQGIVV
jgi:hypothetical protein